MTKQKMTMDKSFDKAVKLTQKGAKETLKSAVKTAELSEELVQNFYKAGYDANVDALKVAKGYWDAATNLRKDWLNLFSDTTEAAIEAAPKMQLPYQKDLTKFGKGMFDSVTGTFEGFMPKSK